MMGKRKPTASALAAPDWESCAPREVAERQGVTTGYARMLPVLKRQIISASATLERERDAERDLKRMLHSRNNTDQPDKQEHAQLEFFRHGGSDRSAKGRKWLEQARGGGPAAKGMTSHLSEALELALSLGWRVLPCHSAGGGRCSCGKYPCGTDNRTAGKHPLTARGLSDATKDEQQIRMWAHKWPECNWAVATGQDSGIWVLDVDGESGKDSLRSLVEKHGKLAKTITVTTARGQHFYFAYPVSGTIRNSVGKLGHGLDVRGDGGYALVPPSIHSTGARYEWTSLLNEFVPACAPAWLL